MVEAPARKLLHSKHVETEEELILDEEASHDDESWYMGTHDFVSVVVRPEELQPFYIMPVFFATKLILTLFIFGFTLSFKEIRPEGACKTNAKWLVQQISGLGMIALALHGYYVDGKKIYLSCQQLELSSQRCAVAFLILITPANYVASRAIWISHFFVNPTNLLGFVPKSDCIMVFGSDVPLIPGTVTWLPCLKHVYALFLLPCFIPYLSFQFCTGCGLCVWSCVTKFSIEIGLFVTCFRMTVALSCACSTLFLWSWPRDCFLYWWSVEWSNYYLIVLEIWAFIVAPILLSLIYGVLACVSRASMAKSFSLVLVKLSLEEKQKKQLRTPARIRKSTWTKPRFPSFFHALQHVPDHVGAAARNLRHASLLLFKLRGLHGLLAQDDHGTNMGEVCQFTACHRTLQCSPSCRRSVDADLISKFRVLCCA